MSHAEQAADAPPRREAAVGDRAVAEPDEPGRPGADGTTSLPGPQPLYSELDPHAAPEVVYSGLETCEKTTSVPAGEASRGSPGLCTPAAPSTQARRPGCPVACLCQPWAWARRKPYLAAAAAALALGVIALIVLPIVLHSVALDGENSHSSAPSSSTSTSCPSCSQPASVPSAAPTSSSPTAAQCTNHAAWAQNVSFLGIAESNGDTWPYKLLPARTAADCCTQCFVDFTAGCQGWAFLPWDNTPVPCTIVYGWNSTDGVSSACPDGTANVTLTSSTGHAGSVGAAGPCGRDAP